MNVKWYCNSNNGSSFEIAPDYADKAVSFFIESDHGMVEHCALRLDELTEVIDMLKLLAKKIEDFDSKTKNQ
jgi:hypothetical protein